MVWPKMRSGPEREAPFPLYSSFQPDLSYGKRMLWVTLISPWDKMPHKLSLLASVVSRATAKLA